MNLLGIGLESGQDKPGLRHSIDYIKEYLVLFCEDRGDIRSPSQARSPKIHSEADLSHRLDARLYREAYERVRELLREGPALLNWGGDHSVAIATVGAFNEVHPDGKVLWVDAHADLNHPAASPSGNFHGMPVAVLLDLEGVKARFPWMRGRLRPENLIYLGLRDLDPFEERTLRERGLRAYALRDIRARGMAAIAEEILALTRRSPLHVSFDIDSVDPRYAPATGVPVADGLNMNELQILARALARHGDLKSLDMVEINPRLGSPSEVERTYVVALQFLNLVFKLYQGGTHVRTGGTNQTNDTASLEPDL